MEWKDVVISIITSGTLLGIFELIVNIFDKKNDRKRKEKEKEDIQKEKDRKEFELYMLQGMMASITLSEATAKAVQRIPDAHCNGDMTEALHEEAKIKKELQDFLAKQSVENIIT